MDCLVCLPKNKPSASEVGASRASEVMHRATSESRKRDEVDLSENVHLGVAGGSATTRPGNSFVTCGSRWRT